MCVTLCFFSVSLWFNRWAGGLCVLGVFAVQNGWFGRLKEPLEDIERRQGSADSKAVRHQSERQLGAVR
jgi:hypothetical protein